jgi:hypothetical protein
MGEGMFGQIMKGPIHQAVDAIVNSGERDTFLADLQSAATANDYLDILKKNHVKEYYLHYLRRWWYPEADTPTTPPVPRVPGLDGFWPWLQPIYPILRRGLVKALEVARDFNLPLDSYWSSGGTEVQVFVTRSPRQVTRIILTPPTPPPTEPHGKDNKLIWVVRRGSLALTVGDDSHIDEVVEAKEDSQGLGIITWRIKDLSDEPETSKSTSKS